MNKMRSEYPKFFDEDIKAVITEKVGFNDFLWNRFVAGVSHIGFYDLFGFLVDMFPSLNAYPSVRFRLENTPPDADYLAYASFDSTDGPVVTLNAEFWRQANEELRQKEILPVVGGVISHELAHLETYYKDMTESAEVAMDQLGLSGTINLPMWSAFANCCEDHHVNLYANTDFPKMMSDICVAAFMGPHRFTYDNNFLTTKYEAGQDPSGVLENVFAMQYELMANPSMILKGIYSSFCFITQLRDREKRVTELLDWLIDIFGEDALIMPTPDPAKIEESRKMFEKFKELLNSMIKDEDEFQLLGEDLGYGREKEEPSVLFEKEYRNQHDSTNPLSIVRNIPNGRKTIKAREEWEGINKRIMDLSFSRLPAYEDGESGVDFGDISRIVVDGNIFEQEQFAGDQKSTVQEYAGRTVIMLLDISGSFGYRGVLNECEHALGMYEAFNKIDCQIGVYAHTVNMNTAQLYELKTPNDKYSAKEMGERLSHCLDVNHGRNADDVVLSYLYNRYAYSGHRPLFIVISDGTPTSDANDPVESTRKVVELCSNQIEVVCLSLGDEDLAERNEKIYPRVIQIPGVEAVPEAIEQLLAI